MTKQSTYISDIRLNSDNRPDIDELMPDPAPKMVIKIRGHDNVIKLTRRRFLSHLSAFLCFDSLAIMLICVIAGITGAGILKLLIPVWAH